MKAFPTHSISVNDEARVTSIGGEGGMELRDYFAANALQSLIVAYKDDHSLSDQISKRAYYYADAMMKAREK